MPEPRYGVIVSTYRGVTPGALHYYAYAWRAEEAEGDLDAKREQARRAMSAEEAEALNRADGLFDRGRGHPYLEGDLTWRFEDEKAAVGAALAQILRWTGGVRVPVGIGEPWYEEPDERLDWNEYQRLGFVPADGEPAPEAPAVRLPELPGTKIVATKPEIAATTQLPTTEETP